MPLSTSSTSSSEDDTKDLEKRETEELTAIVRTLSNGRGHYSVRQPKRKTHYSRKSFSANSSPLKQKFTDIDDPPSSYEDEDENNLNRLSFNPFNFVNSNSAIESPIADSTNIEDIKVTKQVRFSDHKEQKETHALAQSAIPKLNPSQQQKKKLSFQLFRSKKPKGDESFTSEYHQTDDDLLVQPQTECENVGHPTEQQQAYNLHSDVMSQLNHEEGDDESISMDGRLSILSPATSIFSPNVDEEFTQPSGTPQYTETPQPDQPRNDNFTTTPNQQENLGNNDAVDVSLARRLSKMKIVQEDTTMRDADHSLRPQKSLKSVLALNFNVNSRHHINPQGQASTVGQYASGHNPNFSNIESMRNEDEDSLYQVDDILDRAPLNLPLISSSLANNFSKPEFNVSVFDTFEAQDKQESLEIKSRLLNVIRMLQTKDLKSQYDEFATDEAVKHLTFDELLKLLERVIDANCKQQLNDKVKQIKLNKQVEDFQSTVDDKDDRINKLEKEVARLETENSKMEFSLRSANDLLNESQSQLMKQNKLNDGVQTKLNDHINLISQLSSIIQPHSTKSDSDSLLSHTRSLVSTAQKMREQLQAQTGLQYDLKKENSRIQLLVEQNSKDKEKLMVENLKYKRKLDRLQQQTSEISRSLEEHKDLEEENQRIQSKLEYLEKKYTETQLLMKSKDTNIKELKKAKDDLNQQIEQLDKESARLKNTIGEQIALMVEANALISRKESQLNENEKKILVLSKELNISKLEKDKIAKIINDLEKEYEVNRGEFEKVQSESEIKIKRIKEALRSKEYDLNTYKNKATELSDHCESLLQEKEQLLKSMEILDKRLSKFSSELNSLSDQNRLMRNELLQKQMKMNDLRRSFQRLCKNSNDYFDGIVDTFSLATLKQGFDIECSEGTFIEKILDVNSFIDEALRLILQDYRKSSKALESAENQAISLEKDRLREEKLNTQVKAYEAFIRGLPLRNGLCDYTSFLKRIVDKYIENVSRKTSSADISDPMIRKRTE